MARRVVTGHDENGQAVFVSDEMVEPVTLSLMPGSEFHQIEHRSVPAVLAVSLIGADHKHCT